MAWEVNSEGASSERGQIGEAMVLGDVRSVVCPEVAAEEVEKGVGEVEKG